MKPGAAGSEHPRRRRKLLRWLLIAAGALALLGAWLVATWPDVAQLATRDPETTAFIERSRERQRASGRAAEVAWSPVPLRRIARPLQLAVLVAEDDRFFSHDGFAREEVKKALSDAVERRRAPRGASTLTQQLAKNLWLSPSRNPLRKVKEAVLTVQLERELSKERILELYLNVAEFGPGIHGAEAAARHYYGKSAAALDEAEAAALAASLTRPSTWHPGVTSAGYQRRVALILDRMHRWPWVLP